MYKDVKQDKDRNRRQNRVVLFPLTMACCVHTILDRTMSNFNFYPQNSIKEKLQLYSKTFCIGSRQKSKNPSF